MTSGADIKRMTTFMRIFGDELRWARKSNGWTRRDLVDRLETELSAQTIAAYELGTRNCSVVRFVEITEALDVPPPDVFRRAYYRLRDLEHATGWVIDLVAASRLEHAELGPLSRWARCQLRALREGEPTVKRLDLAALQLLAELCGVSTIDLIRLMASKGSTIGEGVRD